MKIKALDITTLSDKHFSILKWTLSSLSAAVTFALIQSLDIGLL